MAKKKKLHFELENYQHPDQFGQWLGYELSKVDRKNQTVETRLRIREDHLSPAGRVHGGVISAMFDYACGAAVFSVLKPKDFCSTVELKVNYFRPLELGDQLRTVARVVFLGKRLCTLHAYLYRNKEKEPVAMCTGTFNIVRVESNVAKPQKGASGMPLTAKARSK